MSYLEKKYGRNIVVTEEIVPDKKKDNIPPKQEKQVKLKTLYLLLVITFILGLIIGSVVSNIVIKSTEVQCLDILKGGGIDGWITC